MTEVYAFVNFIDAAFSIVKDLDVIHHKVILIGMFSDSEYIYLNHFCKDARKLKEVC